MIQFENADSNNDGYVTNDEFIEFCLNNWDL